MSWPADGQPRFKVGSVTGVAITEASIAANGRNGRLATAWVVMDRAYCHRTVAEFSRNTGLRWETVEVEVMDWQRVGGKWQEVTVTKTKKRPVMRNAEWQARTLAAQLEAEHAQP